VTRCDCGAGAGSRAIHTTGCVTQTFDVSVETEGVSLVLIRPLNLGVSDWLKENTEGEWFGGALVVEPRYADTLIDGLRDAGYSVT